MGAKNFPMIMAVIFLTIGCLCVLGIGCGGSGGESSGGFGYSSPSPTSSSNPNPNPNPNPTPQTTPGIWEDGLVGPWFMPAPPKTGVLPELGSYLLRSTNSNDGYYKTFKVIDKDGKKYMHWGDIGDESIQNNIEIIEGSFLLEWGFGVGLQGVNHWPTDPHAISGCFTTTSQCEGLIKFPELGKLQRYIFIATLQK